MYLVISLCYNNNINLQVSLGLKQKCTSFLRSRAVSKRCASISMRVLPMRTAVGGRKNGRHGSMSGFSHVITNTWDALRKGRSGSSSRKSPVIPARKSHGRSLYTDSKSPHEGNRKCRRREMSFKRTLSLKLQAESSKRILSLKLQAVSHKQSLQLARPDECPFGRAACSLQLAVVLSGPSSVGACSSAAS